MVFYYRNLISDFIGIIDITSAPIKIEDFTIHILTKITEFFLVFRAKQLHTKQTIFQVVLMMCRIITAHDKWFLYIHLF